MTFAKICVFTFGSGISWISSSFWSSEKRCQFCNKGTEQKKNTIKHGLD
jgi:hypothetical protein